MLLQYHTPSTSYQPLPPTFSVVDESQSDFPFQRSNAEKLSEKQDSDRNLDTRNDSSHLSLIINSAIITILQYHTPSTSYQPSAPTFSVVDESQSDFPFQRSNAEKLSEKQDSGSNLDTAHVSLINQLGDHHDPPVSHTLHFVSALTSNLP